MLRKQQRLYLCISCSAWEDNGVRRPQLRRKGFQVINILFAAPPNNSQLMLGSGIDRGTSAMLGESDRVPSSDESDPKKQNLPSIEPMGDDMARRANLMNSIWDYQQSSARGKAPNCCSLRFIKGVHHFCVSGQGPFMAEPNHTRFRQNVGR
jgi:hypothetical protein